MNSDISKNSSPSDRIYIITRMNGSVYSFLFSQGRAVEIHCDKESSGTALGDIYIGKIKNIAKNIDAAFVEILPGEVCYLALGDVKNPIYTKKGSSKLPQAGDELLVQISREKIKSKFPSVSTNLTLHGKYVLLTVGKTEISVSSKLSADRKNELRELAKQYEAKYTEDGHNGNNGDPDSTEPEKGFRITSAEAVCGMRESQRESAFKRRYGWLFRTNSGQAGDILLLKDMERLRSRYEELLQTAQYRPCFTCMQQTPPAYLSRLSDLYDAAVDRIFTDVVGLFTEIRNYLHAFQPEDAGKLSFYQDDLLPMKSLYSLERELARALQEKVWLDSGGYLVIQPTEALTVIDVNTGKYEGGKKKEAAFLKINLEAAREIARQIRLRNLSGIILVDFINMEEKEHDRTLLSELDGHLRRDPIPTVLVDMTRLSLVEITRRKKEKPLAAAISDA